MATAGSCRQRQCAFDQQQLQRRSTCSPKCTAVYEASYLVRRSSSSICCIDNGLTMAYTQHTQLVSCGRRKCPGCVCMRRAGLCSADATTCTRATCTIAMLLRFTHGRLLLALQRSCLCAAQAVSAGSRSGRMSCAAPHTTCAVTASHLV